MKKFPFPLTVADYNGVPYIGYYPPAGKQFIPAGFDGDGWPSDGLDETNGHYLNKLNSILAHASAAALETISANVLSELRAYTERLEYFRAAENNHQIRRSIAEAIVRERVVQDAIGMKEMGELTVEYRRYMEMSKTAYASLEKRYAKLDDKELRMLVDQMFMDISDHWPDYRIAFYKLGWDHRFLDSMESGGKGNLIRFYVMLKQLRTEISK